MGSIHAKVIRGKENFVASGVDAYAADDIYMSCTSMHGAQ